MKIIHIFPNSLFLNPYLALLEKNYNPLEHQFIVTDIGAKTKIDERFLKVFKIKEVSTFKLSDVKIVSSILKTDEFDKIMIHSLYLNYLLLALIFNKKVLSKATLMLWGGSDARKFKVGEENKKYVLLAFFYEQLRKTVYKNVNTIASIVPGDYESVKKTYKTRARYQLCKYAVPTSDNLFNKNDYIREDNEKKMYLQVGHSGSPDGDVLESLEILSKFKDCNLEVFSPLAYGNDEYIAKVIERGNKLFGDHFHPIVELMNGEAFSKFIMEMDGLVLNTKIQQGLGNIYSYCYAEKKVFLSENGFLWQYFNNEGYDFNSIEKISEQNFNELQSVNKVQIKTNYEASKKFFDDKELIVIWNDIFCGGKNNE